jgi:antitoxin component of MazEF toxin-antitoxin module
VEVTANGRFWCASPANLPIAQLLSQGVWMITLGLWGRALALRIPSHIAHAAKLRPGISMEMRLRDDGTIVVNPLGAAKGRAALTEDLPPYEDVRDPDEREAAAQRRW